MTIGVLGTGNVGRTLARRWATQGNTVWLGSREPQRAELQQLLQDSPGQLEITDLKTAADAADVVVLAVPWQAAEQVIRDVGDLSGKVLIDCINPINAQFTGLDLGFSISCAERIATWASGASVVKAFNTVSAATMADAMYGEHQATMFYCGDDEQAKSIVHQLATQLGLEAVDAGGLQAARNLEPLAMLYIDLAVHKGWGSNCAFKILRRETK